MKITRIVIGDYHQFGYLNIDLTYPKGHPKEGKPLDKVCFIGKNGTGKTTILNALKDNILWLTHSNQNIQTRLTSNVTKAQFCIEFYVNGKKYLLSRFIYKSPNKTISPPDRLILLPEEVYIKFDDFYDKIFLNHDPEFFEDIYKQYDQLPAEIKSFSAISESIKKDALLISSPTEYRNNTSFTDFSSLSNLNDALNFGKNLPYYHEISFDNLKNFWSLLIYQVQQRERARNEFENREDNLNKTKQELIDVFEKQYPEILSIIADKWKIILDDVGLFFDTEDVRKPIVLTDALVAYIKDKKTKKNISFGELSSGIKNLIFTLGYMLSLYFHREVKSSIAMFDEPEFSLFPDILLKLIDIYTDPKDFPNTQFFFATHSPLIASQFDPQERVCLHFDEERKVYATKGISPIGDNPDDILKNDFDLVEIMPKQGVEKWEEYLRLKRFAEREKNKDTKDRILEQMYKIRSTYKFPA